jgi:predicted O-methyltransferase YrrM
MEKPFAYKDESPEDTLSLHSHVISKIVEMTGCKLYLELGVLQGSNIKKILELSPNCECVGVDIQDIRLFKDFEFHRQTTDLFFKDFNRNPNVIFIDADHHFEQVKIDFENSLNCLSEHGIIFLHDTDPFNEYLLNQIFCGDSYKMHDWIKNEHPELNIITLPISVAGLTMVNREKDRRVFKFLK